ncbi:hypothetical protein [Nostoc commune]|uniref:hypothetical protein n=1 Tax=Nostoc commune TaxID=1178 RepID=UPI0018C6FA05|nr:hypothetical protein [Nostoc commune]
MVAAPELMVAAPELMVAAPELMGGVPKLMGAVPKLMGAVPELMGAVPELTEELNLWVASAIIARSYSITLKLDYPTKQQPPDDQRI